MSGCQTKILVPPKTNKTCTLCPGTGQRVQDSDTIEYDFRTALFTHLPGR